jgi:hypothetical protein
VLTGISSSSGKPPKVPGPFCERSADLEPPNDAAFEVPEPETADVNDDEVTILSGRCFRWKSPLKLPRFFRLSSSEVRHTGSWIYELAYAAAGVLGEADEGCVSGVTGDGGLTAPVDTACSPTGIVCKGWSLGRTIRREDTAAPLLEVSVGDKGLRGGGGRL